MTKLQQAKNRQIFKVLILADIIEYEILDINPAINVNDTKTMLLMENLKNSCKRFRVNLDEDKAAIAEALGEISDHLDKEINAILN